MKFHMDDVSPSSSPSVGAYTRVLQSSAGGDRHGAMHGAWCMIRISI